MATDTNTKSASGDNGATSTAKVGGGQTNSSRQLKPNKLSKKKLFLALLVVLIFSIAWVVIRGGAHLGQKVYAQADGHKIYKKDIEAIKSNNKSVSDHDAAIVLADKYLSQAMAREHSITVSKADISAAGCPSQKSNPYGYQTCLNQLYFARLGNNNEGTYKGKALIANFSRYIPYPSPLLKEQEALNPKIGDTAAIAADKAYAKNFITNLYNQIISRKISFDQAIQMEHDDPVVGEKAYPSQPHSGAFDGRASESNLVGAYSVRQKIADMKPGEITKPFAPPGNGPAPLAGDPSGETYYLVIKMDQSSGGHSKVSFEQEIQQAKNKLGYKVYV